MKFVAVSILQEGHEPLCGAKWILVGSATGIFYAYWREKSGSLLAPSIGHVSGGVGYVLMFFMTWAWR